LILNYKRVDLDWIQGRNFLQWGQWGTGTGCPERSWMPHYWKHSRPSCTGL